MPKGGNTPSLSSSVCPSLPHSTRLSLSHYPSINPSFTSLHPSVHLSLSLPLCPFICPSLSLPLCPSYDPSVHFSLSVCKTKAIYLSLSILVYSSIIHLSIPPSIFLTLSIPLSISLSSYPSCSLFTCLTFYPSVHLCLTLSICLSHYPSVHICIPLYRSVYLSFYLSPSLCPFICSSVSLFIPLSSYLSHSVNLSLYPVRLSTPLSISQS